MIYKKFLIVLLFTFFFISCNSTTDPERIENNAYPLAENLEWEYNTIFYVEYYDTLGNIKNSVVLFDGNTIVRIESTKDTFSNFYDLIRIVSLDVKDYNKGINWYENKDDGLYVIAYKNAGATQFVIPKIINGKKYLTLDELKKINISLDLDLNLRKTSDDSLRFMTPPRKVLGYPLEIGNSWTELQYPFNRERIIESKEIKNIDGTDYQIFKIVANWKEFNLIFNDYISTKYGLVYREIISDSILITTTESPDGIGYANTKTISKLVRKNF